MSKKNICRLAVLVSGNGSNLQTIIDHIEAGKLKAEITCVISNKADAYALERASRHGIEGIVHANSDFADRRSYDARTVDILKERKVDLVVLAGFMRILTDVMIGAFPNRIMNIHPALLPSFKGLHAQQQALDYGVRYSGCTIHFVDSGTDTGPIIMQSVVPVEQNDTEDTLSAKIQKAEHKTYVAAIKLFIEGKITIDNRRVLIAD
ncbi:MAG: phosphoribosylglycinamide formyltransferase [Desulfuromonadaceae bacterium]|nr:phosphoribosylglycinamide formyltransferase [Desulfuromonadaceae bacterium]MDD2856845.1 phosphoribosylglycinamide formyltransferase [Desulfuromonadaceae bacterium]